MSEVAGVPGVKTSRTATPRDVLNSDVGAQYATKPLILDASKTRDYGNNVTDSSTNDCEYIRAGTILVKTDDNIYVPWILGAVTVAYTGTGAVTSLTVGVGATVAIQKFLGGTSGTVYLSGPPTNAGTVCNSGNGYQSVTVSGINQTTGVLTIADLSADYVVGSVVHPYDGYSTAAYTYAPDAILGDKYGVKVVDRDNNDVDAPVSLPIIGGNIDCTYLIGYPAATQTLFQIWFKQELHRNMPNLTFDDLL